MMMVIILYFFNAIKYRIILYEVIEGFVFLEMDPINDPTQTSNNSFLLSTSLREQTSTFNIPSSEKTSSDPVRPKLNIYQTENGYKEEQLKNMRANYILNKLTKDDFKKKLQMLEKKNNKSKKVNDTWNLLSLVLVEYIGKITEKTYSKEEGIKIIDEIVKESEKIRIYCNTSFYNIGKVFNMVYPGINEDWIQINNWVEYCKKQSST